MSETKDEVQETPVEEKASEEIVEVEVKRSRKSEIRRSERINVKKLAQSRPQRPTPVAKEEKPSAEPEIEKEKNESDEFETKMESPKINSINEMKKHIEAFNEYDYHYTYFDEIGEFFLHIEVKECKQEILEEHVKEELHQQLFQNILKCLKNVRLSIKLNKDCTK